VFAFAMPVERATLRQKPFRRAAIGFRRRLCTFQQAVFE
jgi:hypothetical protein